MPIDPSIISGLKQAQFETPTNALMQLLQVQTAQNQNRLTGITIDAKQQEAQQNILYNNLYKSATGADGTIDRNKLYSGMAEAGLGSKLPGVQKSFQDLDKDQSITNQNNSNAKKVDYETLTHQYEMAGQLAASWAQNPSVNQQQIRSGLAAAQHAKIITPEIYQAKLSELDTVPDDPKLLNQWATSTLQQVMKSKDSMGFIKPDANNVATNERIAAEGKLNRQNQLELERMRGARQDAKGDVEPTLNSDTQLRIAKQFLKGDKSGLQNLGRGAQGAANIVAIQNTITEEGRRQGMTGEDIAARMAEFEGLKAGMRASGTASARIENAAAEAGELAPLALAASQKVTRSGLLPFGKAQVMFDTQTNDPALREFATANIGLATAYAAAMARGGKPTVSDMDHSRELLSTATSPQAYEATVRQMQAEISAAQRAPKHVRQGLSDAISGRESNSPAPSAPTKVRKYNPATGRIE